jgi:hypothetical protein
VSSKVDPPFTAEFQSAELVQLFESCELPCERWTHRAHLAVAATYLQRYPLSEATDRVRVHIQRFNAAQGKHTGYHETITVLYMRLVARELSIATPSNMADLVNGLATRFPIDALLGYYSRERLWSEAARAAFVEPDLRPLDF